MHSLPKREEIEIYIQELHNKQLLPGDINLFKSIKKHIINKYGESSYIKKYITDNIERNIEKLKRFEIYQIEKDDIDIIADYIELVINDKNHIFRPYLIEAIKEKIFYNGFSENISEIISITGILDNIMDKLHILKLHDEDEKLLIIKKRDKKKIKDAIEVLTTYTNDPNVEHYLKTIDIYEKNLTKETLLSCAFCNLTFIIKESFTNLKKKEIEDLSKEIMKEIFLSEKDYRIYNNVEYIQYKNYKLRKFTTK